MLIRPGDCDDSLQIAEIYNQYIDSSHSTFELDPIDATEMENRVRDKIKQGYPILVGVEDEKILGYAYGNQFRERPAYRFSVETSVYVRPGNENKRIGTRLYEKLLPEIEKADYHVVIAGISLPNLASVRLHEKFGFEKAAHFREVGFKFGRWIDVGYWQKTLRK